MNCSLTLRFLLAAFVTLSTLTACDEETEETECTSDLVPACIGTSSICSQMTNEFECDGHDGCEFEIQCTGLPEACHTLDSQVDCIFQVGCMWLSSSSSCSGVVTQCTELAAGECLNQLGCGLEGLCDGVATPCSSMIESYCDEQEGCEMGETCLD